MAALAGQPTTAEQVRTLWIGDLQYWVDESYLSSCFAHTGEVISVKIIRNRITGQPEGYGFVEFASRAEAERILQTYNGIQMPGTELTFRLNWASYGTGERRPDAAPEHPIFLWNLAYAVTDYLLKETFRMRYPSVTRAKVVTDPNTGHSIGHGFVNFANENERNRARVEMDGVYCLTRPMRIGEAMPRKATGVHQQYSLAMYPVPAYSTPAPVLPADYDANNTTVYVGNLDPNITKEELKQNFSRFGEIVSVKILAGKGYGFVQFGARSSAEEAIHTMQGKIIGRQLVHTSWSKKSAAEQDLATRGQQVDPNRCNAFYGYGGAYDAYGSGVVQDPSLYAYGAYSGYASYPQQDLATRGQQVDPNRCNAYYGYGGAYDAYGSGVVQDPSLYAYGAYSGYASYPQQDLATQGQQVDPNRGNAYYGYGGAYDAYGSGVVQDPSLYAYGAYSGHASYPQQPFSIGGHGVDAVQDLAAVAGAAPVVEQGDEWDDTLDTPDVDHLNDAYLSKHESAILGRPLWLTTSSLARQT